MSDMKIFVSENELKILQDIFKEHPNAYLFGSRTTGRHKQYSDLDVCFIRENETSDLEISLLKENCEESALPFTVDIIDYHKISDDFKKVIESTKVPFPYA